MGKVKAKVVQMTGVTFMGSADSNHWVPMDGPEQFGGSNAGTRPKEFLLLALGGCTGSDVASILKKMREPVERFEVAIEGEMAETHPKIYTKLHVTYKVWGQGIREENLKRAIELSVTTYCAVTAMLKDSVKITESYEINPQD